MRTLRGQIYSPRNDWSDIQYGIQPKRSKANVEFRGTMEEKGRRVELTN